MIFSLPFTASTWTILLIFVVLLIVFDLILVRWLKLGNFAWKIVDYIWLGVGALGLIGAASQSRQITATNFLPFAVEVKTMTFQSAQQYVSGYRGSPIICRTFTRTEFSPPPEELDRISKEYATVCTWFEQLYAVFPQTEPTGGIDPTGFPVPPEVTSRDLQDIIGGFARTLDPYNVHATYVENLRRKAQRSEAETSLMIVIPLLLAIALALRITKVTGEIKLARPG